eukprot:1818569-Pleurochrysis_carterae.AAC.1
MVGVPEQATCMRPPIDIPFIEINSSSNKNPRRCSDHDSVCWCAYEDASATRTRMAPRGVCLTTGSDKLRAWECAVARRLNVVDRRLNAARRRRGRGVAISFQFGHFRLVRRYSARATPWLRHHVMVAK